MKYSLSFMNDLLLSLMQACMGLIHPDMLYIGLIPNEDNGTLVLKIVFEDKVDKSSEAFDELIEDIATDFYVYSAVDLSFDINVEYVTEEEFEIPAYSARHFYRRYRGNALIA